MSASAPALTERLREGTRPLHRAAERAGVMRALLAGTLDRAGYARLLRNLHALYAALEDELERPRPSSPDLAPLRLPTLYRTATLAADLDALAPSAWRMLPLTAATVEYVTRLRAIGADDPALLGAHAYVRYLGDLSGGQILREIVRRAFALPGATGTRFYAFEGDVATLKQQLRRALDGPAISPARHDAVVAEAQAGFALHIRLFDELQGPAATPV